MKLILSSLFLLVFGYCSYAVAAVEADPNLQLEQNTAITEAGTTVLNVDRPNESSQDCCRKYSGGRVYPLTAATPGPGAIPTTGKGNKGNK